MGANTDIHGLKMAQRRLEEETALIDKFVSPLTHDLRTPLTAAKMSAEMIKRKVQEDPAPMFAVRIIDSLNRANKMIEDLSLEVYLSPDGMRRILENLCSKAIKYGSTTEHIHVTIIGGKKRASICVHNQGNPLINIDNHYLHP